MPFHPYFHGTPFIIIGSAGNMEIIPKLMLTSKNVHSWLLAQTANHNIDDTVAIHCLVSGHALGCTNSTALISFLIVKEATYHCLWLL